ncbi:MAG: CopD family protein [gamma proteobacterium symbiont of Phacoides pectinatus]
MLWVKSFHLIFLVSWYAGLFYLPRLYVHHAMAEDRATRERLEIMERKLFWFITPWALLTLAFGIWLWVLQGWGMQALWLNIKVLLVLPLIGFHLWCWKLMMQFRGGPNPHSHVWFRWFNEFPLLILVAVVLLVILKPF